jgi:2,5-dichlorohydroquinone reductive dechlorinase
MANPDFSALVAAANAPLTDPSMNRIVGEHAKRFELYHFALSLCSQKVRACLAEKDASYIAHDINLQMPLFGNYDPAYVRLRMLGDNTGTFATGYTGRSSVATEGFDPAVVPTLVDHDKKLVYVDSVNICRQIDALVAPASALIPTDLSSQIDAEVSIVDGTPHVAVLYGAHPDMDFRPKRLQKGMPGVHGRKIEKIQKACAQAAGDTVLTAAYDAKIAKETAARAHVTSPARMRASVDEIVGVIRDLENRLHADSPWVCGDRFTMADVIWGVSLFRLQWLGMAFCWLGSHPLNKAPHPKVHQYGETLFERPAFRTAIIDWPIARTEYVEQYYKD